MISVTESDAREGLDRLLDKVSSSHEPVLITGEHGGVVLVGEQEWRALQETLYLISQPGVREAIVEGVGTPVDQCECEIDW